VVEQRPSFSEYYERPLYRILFRWIDRRKLTVIRRALATVNPDAVLIDVGCGSGRILARVARAGDLAVAADRDLRLLHAAGGCGLHPVRTDFDLSLPFADESIDAALLIDTIEHAVEPRRVLNDVRRVLRGGGIAVVFTPPYDSVRWILAERLHRLITGRRADHISPFTHESLSWAMAACFEDLRLGWVNGKLSMYAIGRKAPVTRAGPNG
jgi:SAM-dependent methyltransferase